MVRSSEVLATPTSAVVVKRATGADVSTLRAEAERLAAVAHPGVVQLVSSSGTDELWELRIAHAGRPVDIVGVLPVVQVAGVIAAVASTLADLHERGTVHGRIDASHVLIGRHGRPVLCGLGPEPTGAAPADDVAAVGSLLTALLGSGADTEPIPERRWPPRPAWSGWERRALLLIAGQACADPPTRRPTARRLAAAIAAAIPDAVVIAPDSPPPDSSTPSSDPIEVLRSTASADVVRTPPRVAALAGALAGVLIVGAGALSAMRPHASIGVEPPAAVIRDVVPATPSPVPPTSIGRPPTTTTTSPPAPMPCVAPSRTATASEACVEPVLVDGTTVLVGARRFEVGRPGDLVVLGDWDCDGSATPAALRPSTGEVFVFSSWAAEGDVLVRPTVRIPNALAPHVEASIGGCANLVVERADGTRVAVATERSA
ncbi:MAG: hypothetical protein ACRDZU_04920 [Acidimicrobiales bacterium]